MFAIFKFELRYHLKQPLFYILALIYFLLTFGAVTSDVVQIGGAVGNIHRNAPFVIMQFLLLMSVFGVLTTTAFVANSAHRDFELNTDSLFFTSPIKKASYLAGRYGGSVLVGILVYLGVVLAIMIGSFMPWLEKERLGPFELAPYLYSLFVMVAPSLLLIGAIFFSVAALTRSLMATYSSVVAFFVAWAVSRAMMRDIENDVLAALLDPFGVSAFARATRYWTVHQRNSELLPLEGLFLANRLLWLGAALVILGFTFWKFKFEAPARKSSKKRKIETAELGPVSRIALALPRVSQTFGGGTAWRQFLASVRIETKSIVKSIPFIIIVMLGCANICGNSATQGRLFGTPVYPVTSLMVQIIGGGFVLFSIIIAAFFSGDSVWRERSVKLNEVHDALPMPTWVMWASKFASVCASVIISLGFAVATAVLIQLAKGYTNLEPLVYVKRLFLETGLTVLLLAALAFIAQVLTNNKYIGFFVVMLYLVMEATLSALDLDHNLYRFASSPSSPYSDMNGYGHFVAPILWFTAYWICFTGLMLVIAHLLWVRGTESRFSKRLRAAKLRFSKPVMAALIATFAGFASTGCYIFYNTNVLNTYRPGDAREKMQAEFEKKYSKYEWLAQPRITDVKAEVDIFPERRGLEIRGQYTLANKSGKPIGELHVTYNPEVIKEKQFTVPGTRLQQDDRELGYAIYTFAPPLAPGATTTLSFRTTFQPEGFVNGASNTNVVYNGTFINSGSYFPHLGYSDGVELQDRNKRRKHGLPPLERMAKPDDPRARMVNGLARDADWINLDTTVSTSADQIALAPGYLQKEWTSGGRKYFHYKTTAPILSFWAYLSARYQVKRDQWNGIPIEIYYDAQHPYNVDRMIYASKKSLEYFTKNFSPYQHKQVRILEFPGYASFAQSFPNTIPYSESIGFIADLRGEESIDYVYYVTAHEIAHQWWGHQVAGGDVQGSTMLVETMAQYSALMVMEKEYGRDKMKRFLEYELDRYLSGRGGELIAEMPIVLVENQQYIHYRKGSLVMYALRDYIGEDKVNAACAAFLRDHAFENPPYTTAGELVRYFRQQTPPELQNVVTDLFERITVYDNKASDVTWTRLNNGKYLVRLTVESKKFYGDAKGEEKPTTVNDWIDIGVLGPKAKNGDEKVLFLEKRRITAPKMTFELTVNEAPAKAGIDPLNKLIDRNPDDNTKSGTEADKTAM
ncbi:MAG TPA: M1 family aminopeptidase [Thermoanaerobaculia bacterium]|jgi:ABC-type transport system involved in multi-copper enzyme maturation permease subunit